MIRQSLAKGFLWELMLPLLFMLVWIAFSANHALAHGCWSAPLGGVTIAACPGNMADGAPARAAEDR